MKLTRKAVLAILLIVFCIGIHFYSINPYRVEYQYSNHFFMAVATALRSIFGWLPFSMGDLLYAGCFSWLLIKLIKGLRSIFRKSNWKQFSPSLYNKLLKMLVLFSSVYIVFNVFWGINYNRKGIAWQLDLKMEKYSTDELKQMNAILVEKINASKKILANNNTAYPSTKELIKSVKESYDLLSRQYPYLQYRHVSLKSSMWGWLGNYAGFTGYYNPFTGEAQLNTTVPKFLQPYTACHEVAHQLGYAKEMEANFVGYLAAANSTDTLFHYSVYLDLFNYANRNLYFTDSTAAKDYRKLLSPEVNTDIKEWIAFSRRHKNPVEPFIRWGYGVFLRNNQQPQGILSYDEVTGFIIAYYKKFGRI